MNSDDPTTIAAPLPWWRCQWCGGSCPRWGKDVCPMRLQPLPKPDAFKKKWKAPPKDKP